MKNKIRVSNLPIGEEDSDLTSVLDMKTAKAQKAFGELTSHIDELKAAVVV